MKKISGLFLILSLVTGANAELSAPSQILPGIMLQQEIRTNNLPQHLFVATVDLKDPRLHLRVAPGGPDPDGDGRWETTLMEPTRIADRERFDFVINGDFFIAKGVNDGEGTNSHFRAEQWALTEGAAMTDGRAWSNATNARPALVVSRDGGVSIALRQKPQPEDWQVIGGNVMLVKEGTMVHHSNTNRHPRTVAGLNAAGNCLTLLVVDGRKPGVAAGMTYDELAAEMIRLGCHTALNLDGGGSSVMAYRGPETGKLKIVNRPTDGRERAVADVLGISVDPQKP